MTVKQLIKKLEKMPKNLQVYWADHDHGRFETNNIANFVELVDKNEMTEIENDDNCRYSDCYKDTPNKYVVIRP